MFTKIKEVFDKLRVELVNTNDTPQHIAWGFAVGFLLGLLPFTGPVAAVGVAWYFRLNKAAAILGSLISNAWLTLVVAGISFHVVAWYLRLSIADLQTRFQAIFKDFHWGHLSDPFLLKITGAVIATFILVSLLLSFCAYLACLAFVLFKRRR